MPAKTRTLGWATWTLVLIVVMLILLAGLLYVGGSRPIGTPEAT